MITPATSDSLNAEHLAEYQLTGRLQRNVDPGVSGELLFRPHPTAHFGRMACDPIKIKNKMDVTVDRYINHVYPPLEDGPFHFNV